ncbi:MAG: hypothetical protein Q9225_000712 [Loekoesia sp. 1 TL-2023]
MAKVKTISTYKAMKIGDEDKEDAGGGEDVSGNCDPHIAWIAGPDDAHDLSDDARHAEAKDDAGDEEFVIAFEVGEEDGHMADGAKEEEEEEDGGDGNIDTFGG